MRIRQGKEAEGRAEQRGRGGERGREERGREGGRGRGREGGKVKKCVTGEFYPNQYPHSNTVFYTCTSLFLQSHHSKLP